MNDSLLVLRFNAHNRYTQNGSHSMSMKETAIMQTLPVWAGRLDSQDENNGKEERIETKMVYGRHLLYHSYIHDATRSTVNMPLCV